LHAISTISGAALFERPALAELASASSFAPACVPLLAGLSEMAGQSFVLVSRRVHLAQAIASYGLTALVHIGGVLIWTCTALLLTKLSPATHAPTALIFNTVAVCYAPRLLGLLTIAPYYGELLGRALDAWTMACVGWGVFVMTGLSLPAALVCASVGWIAIHLSRHFGARLTTPILNRLGLVIAGVTDA
jgi:hypothetical protein